MAAQIVCITGRANLGCQLVVLRHRFSSLNVLGQFVGHVCNCHIRPDKSNVHVHGSQRRVWDKVLKHLRKPFLDCGLTHQPRAIHVNKIAVFGVDARHHNARFSGQLKQCQLPFARTPRVDVRSLVTDSIFETARDPTNRPGGPKPNFTIDTGRFTVRRARLAPAMISTPGHRASRRRQRGALPAWSLFGSSRLVPGE
jgi:hypothetical protein